jgi:ribonucleoside-diphosphate reductase alpha chain
LKKGKKYSYEKVLAACLRYFDNDELAASAWMGKYAMKDAKGNFLEPDPSHMHRRMAKQFARIEKKFFKKPSAQHSGYGRMRGSLTEEKIFSLFDKFRYVIPQGSVMSALGNPNVVASLSNCVVLPKVYDSYAGILTADQQMAQLFKRRCGVGVDISSIRPAGMPVSNAARSTSGAVSFMERYSNTTREVAQHGRRGALMITMDIAHPDIEKFIVSKQDRTKVTGANISVRLSDEFMRAVEKNKKFTLRFPVEGAVKFVPTPPVKWRSMDEEAH